MSTTKPTTTRYPLSVLSWIAVRLREEKIPVDIYHDLGADVILTFDRTSNPAKERMAASNASKSALAAELCQRFLPNDTMPAEPKPYANKGRKAAQPVQAELPPPPPEPKTPSDFARLNGIGQRR